MNDTYANLKTEFHGCVILARKPWLGVKPPLESE